MREKKYCELTELKAYEKANYSYRKFAKRLSMSTDALSNKLNGYSYFNLEEADKIVHILGIDKNDISIYFFPACCLTQYESIYEYPTIKREK